MGTDEQRRRRLATGLALATVSLLVAGLAAGSDGWSLGRLAQTWSSPDGVLIIGRIRAPRTLGAWLIGALLGLTGATAQGLFRNPLADPYLRGSGSGASLGVVLVLTASVLGGTTASLATAGLLLRLGLVGAAFVGALLGVLLTLTLARGAQQTTRLLLAGVVVGVVLAAVSDLVTSAAPEALRAKQAFMLGSTGFLGWSSCAVLAIGLAVTLPPCWRLVHAGTTVVSVLHDLSLALLADRIVVMDHGRIHGEGVSDDPALHAELIHVFGGAIRIVRVGSGWVSVPHFDS